MDICWKAHLNLLDATGQLRVTAFDAMQAFAQCHADGDPTLLQPNAYHEAPEQVKALMMSIAAVPFTALLSFEDSDFSETMEAHVHSVKPTFRSAAATPRHPLKPLLRCSSRMLGCPPCALSETRFEAGIGMSVVAGGGAVLMFRAFLELADKPGGVQRESDTSPACRVTRKVFCGLRGEEEVQTYQITQEGAIDEVTHLQGPKKGDFVHCLLAWRSQTRLSVLAFTAIDKESNVAFRNFFHAEKTTLEAGAESVLPDAAISTPTRTAAAASQAARALASPTRWGSPTA